MTLKYWKSALVIFAEFYVLYDGYFAGNDISRKIMVGYIIVLTFVSAISFVVHSRLYKRGVLSFDGELGKGYMAGSICHDIAFLIVFFMTGSFYLFSLWILQAAFWVTIIRETMALKKFKESQELQEVEERD